jgi:rhodanese-related sulfurtransferase
MNKFIKENWIFLSALLAVIVIIAILSSTGKPQINYRLSPQEVFKTLSDKSNQVSPLAVYDQVKKGNKSQVLVDVRNSDEFAKGHIEGAVNIPVLELLQKRSLSFFKELNGSKQVAILYGEDQLQANGPWMLLKQIGFENIKVLEGGYAFYKTLPLPDSLLKIKEADWKVETQQIDTSQFGKHAQAASEAASATAKKAPEKVIPVKKKGSTGGGC